MRALQRCWMRWFILSSALLVAVAAPTHAQESEDYQPSASIDATDQKPDDVAIADRIQDIFSVIDGLEAITIDVNEGVVVLSGQVLDDGSVTRAASIAGRVSGVVTVENEITRDLSIDQNLQPVIDKLWADADNLMSALPLAVIAAVLAMVIGFIGHILASFRALWLWVAPNAFLADLFATFVRVSFIAIGVFAGLDLLNATAVLGAVLGGAGVIGLAVGFAVRDTVDNYISSIMLSVRQPFRANDFVKIGDRQGRVVRLTSRATILMTLDGNQLRIPNAVVFKSEILNFSRNPERRFTFQLGVDADDDPAAAIDTGLEAINVLPFILPSPKATGSIKEVGDSNIVLTFNGWINQRDTDFLKARGSAIRNTKMALEDAGFALPEPIYRLRFDAAPGSAGLTVTDTNSDEPPAGTNAADTPSQATERSKAPKRDADLDVTPDTHVELLVEEERAENKGTDLLSDEQEQE